MSTTNETEKTIAAFCRMCGKGLTAEEKREVLGTVYCADHVPAPTAVASALQHTDAPRSSGGASPALAFFLGLIPGVGAVYNAQYAKGLIHAIIFGLLVSILSSDATGGLEPLFGILLTCFMFYMAFEAFHTAKKRRDGEHVDEFSSLIDIRGAGSAFPVGGVVLIALGVLFLLNTLQVVQFRQILKFWPVGLIALGVYLIYLRMAERKHSASGSALEEVRK